MLAIDTAAGACSVAVWDGLTLHERLRLMDRGHAEALVPLVREVMQDAGCAFDALDLLAVTIGPGAFTGLRVGLATARGIRAATGLPCLGVTTLEAIAAAAAAGVPAERPLLVALDTRRGDVYAQVFRDGRPEAPAEVLAIAEAARRNAHRGPLLAGDAAPTVLEALETEAVSEGLRAEIVANVPGHPTAGWVARIAWTRWREAPADPGPPSPLYLRAPATGPRTANGPRTAPGPRITTVASS